MRAEFGVCLGFVLAGIIIHKDPYLTPKEKVKLIKQLLKKAKRMLK